MTPSGPFMLCVLATLRIMKNNIDIYISPAAFA